MISRSILQAEILKAHRVIAVHAAFELQRENPFQVTTPAAGGQRWQAAWGWCISSSMEP
jgi:hypothetical protein